MEVNKMSHVKYYNYKKCSTCTKAKKFLESRGVDFKDIPIVESPPSMKDLKKMLIQYNGELKKLFNTSGVMYRELGIKDKIKSMSENEALQLLSKNGKLIKRPFLITDDGGLVGFKENEWKALLN
jgi:Spx/MgsR family transcriptional regulator